MRLIRTLIAIIIVGLTLSVYILAAERVMPSFQIIFFAEHEGGLHILNYLTGQIRQIDVGLLDVGDLAYSKASNLLAFEGAKGHEESKSLYLLHLYTKRKERIFSTTERNKPLYRPRFDPVGQYLYAVNYDEGVRRYFLSKKVWEPVSIVGVASFNPQGLAFSKSGKKVAISPGDFRGFLIGNVENGTFIIKEHVLADFDSCISPQWVGEDALIFAGRKVTGLQFLWKLDLVSKKVTQLTHPPIGSRDFLSLSSDEKTIVFTGTSEKLEWRLWRISTDGSGLKQLTQGGNLSSHLSPVWIE